MLWRFVCFAVRKCGRCFVAARAEVRAKLWGTREAEIRTGRPTGTIFSERRAVRSRPRKTGRRHFALAAFPNAFPVGRRACSAQIRRIQPAPCVCGFIQSRMAAAFSVCFAAKKSLPRQAAARGKDAARFLPAVLCRSARRPSRKAGPWRERRFRCGLLDAALEAGGLILRAAASDAFDVPPHFQSGIMSGRACPALGFAVRRLMFRCKRCTQGVVDAHSEACEHSRRECVRSIAAPSQGGAGRSPRVMAAEGRQGRVGRALWYADAFQRRASRA